MSDKQKQSPNRLFPSSNACMTEELRESYFEELFAQETILTNRLKPVSKKNKEKKSKWEQGLTSGKVTRTYEKESSELYRLVFINTSNYETFEVQVTPEHPFYVISPVGKDGKGRYIAVKNLEIGYRCISIAGCGMQLIEKEYMKLDQPVKVYNLEVEGSHNYFVGSSKETSILVHNKCGDCNDTGKIRRPNYFTVICSGTGAYGGTYPDRTYTTEICKCQYGIDKLANNWTDLKGLVSHSPDAAKIMNKIHVIATGTINSSLSWSNAVPKPDDIDVIGTSQGEATGNCALWANNVWNRIADIEGVHKKGSELIFIAGDGTAIAIGNEILDYNGWSPKFSSHVVMRIEIGTADITAGGAISDGGVTGVGYMDNGLYGGKDRTFDPWKAGKSLMPYPGGNNKLILDNSISSPLMFVQPQIALTNWF